LLEFIKLLLSIFPFDDLNELLLIGRLAIGSIGVNGLLLGISSVAIIEVESEFESITTSVGSF
jgi:hypothetical protein